MKSENLNFLEPSGPLSACNGLLFTTTHDLAAYVSLWYYIANVLILIRDINFVLTRFIGVSFDMA